MSVSSSDFEEREFSLFLRQGEVIRVPPGAGRRYEARKFVCGAFAGLSGVLRKAREAFRRESELPRAYPVDKCATTSSIHELPPICLAEAKGALDELEMRRTLLF